MVEGCTSSMFRSPNDGKAWRRSRSSTASRVVSSNVCASSHLREYVLKGTLPASGSRYCPRTRSAETTAQKRSALTLRLKVLFRSLTSGLRHRTR